MHSIGNLTQYTKQLRGQVRKIMCVFYVAREEEIINDRRFYLEV